MVEAPFSRDSLVEECQGMVRFLAKQVRSRTPAWVEMDDLVGYGQVGLLQAARDFDPLRGAKFSTFAYYRIRGSIYDGVSKLMWFRTIRDPEVKYNQLVDAYLEPTGDGPAGGPAESGTLAHEASWLTRSAGALAMIFLASADATAQATEVADKDAAEPWSELVAHETHLKLGEAISRLPADSAALIRAMYYEECTLQEAANRLKISKSWASRMHAKALEQMARTLGDVESPDR